MVREGVAVDENDGDGAIAFVVEVAEIFFYSVQVYEPNVSTSSIVNTRRGNPTHRVSS